MTLGFALGLGFSLGLSLGLGFAFNFGLALKKFKICNVFFIKLKVYLFFNLAKLY